MKTTLRILNLEDDVNDAALNEAMLSARWSDCQLTRVDNRADYLAALERGGMDLVLSDYTMPAFSGREALALARERRPEVPFLFVSGTIGEDAAIEALKNGATDYVLKHRLMRLIPAVARALAEVEERAERQRAEEAMRQSEHKYRQLFESLGHAALVTDQQTGKIVDANPRAEMMLGCSRGEILGSKVSRFLALDTARVVPEGSDANARTTLFHCDLVRADRVPVPVTAQATWLTLYDRALILWLCQESNLE
ncbi:MAG: response regulator [Verrucomicrobiota bacterium]|nr:response regulator [Verrucomicrobiota bacterium]